MAQVTIPDYAQPYWTCEVNGIKYAYPAGSTQDVPDEVADVIRNWNSLQPREAVELVKDQAQLTADVKTLADALSALAERVTTAETTLSPLPAKVSALEGAAEAANTAITALEGVGIKRVTTGELEEGVAATMTETYATIKGWFNAGKIVVVYSPYPGAADGACIVFVANETTTYSGDEEAIHCTDITSDSGGLWITADGAYWEAV